MKTHLQSNVAIYLVQLVNELVDLLNDEVFLFPDWALLALLAGVCLCARFRLRGKRDRGSRTRQLMPLCDWRLLLPISMLLLPLQ